jgi:predicted dehydrogenase
MEILIVGLGSIAFKHIKAIQSIEPNARISALRSSKEAKSLDGVQDIYALNEFIGNPDFVLISNPTVMHSKTIFEFCDWGVPLFIEKPPIESLDSADEILKRLKERNIRTYVAFNLRFHPCIMFLKKFLKINSADLNEVNVYCGSYLPEWRPNTDYRQNYSASKEMGGGVHLDLIHELDYIHCLFGNPVNYQGKISKKSKLEIDSPDFAQYLLEYEGFFVNCTLNYYRRDPKRNIELVFDGFTLSVDLIKCRIVHSDKGLIFEEHNYSILNTYEEQMKYFMQTMVKNERFMNSFEDSLSVLKIALNLH